MIQRCSENQAERPSSVSVVAEEVRSEEAQRAESSRPPITHWILATHYDIVLQQSQLSSRDDHPLKAERVHLPFSTVYAQDSFGTTCQSESFSQHGE